VVRAAQVALTLLAVGLLASCGDEAGSSPTPERAPELSAVATRSSLFDSQRTFRLELTNEGGDDVTVERLQLRSGLFDEVEASARDTQLAAGRRVLVPLPYGDSVCPAADEPSVVVVEVDGQEVEVPLGQDPEAVMDDLHASECDQQAVRDAVDLSFGEVWQSTGPRSAAGEVRVEPTGGTGVEVRSMAGNIVFGVRLGGGILPSAATFPVEVVVDRCDTHALIESKRTFKFPLEVSLDGGEPVTYVLEAAVDTPAREAFADLIQACIA
jgi:hypothetical protein